MNANSKLIPTALRGILTAAAVHTALHSAEPPPSKVDDEMVVLSEFQVSTSQDQGYRASNSVTGSRFSTPIKDLPFALQAFTSDFISDIKPSNIIDVAIYSPGVTFRSNDFNEGNVNVAIRGFESGAILRDGFKGPHVMDFTNVARVEIVKGPASFLYGQLAPGGVLSIVTKTPLEKFQATVGASYGSYNEHRVDVDVTGPVGKTGLFYRVASSYFHDIDYWKPYSSHQTVVAPQLLWKMNENASFSVKVEHLEKRESPQLMQLPGWGYSGGLVPTAADPNLSGVAVPILPDNWNSMTYSDFRDSNSDSMTAALDIKAGGHWSMRSVFAHAKDRINSIFSGNLGMANGTYFQGRRWRGWDQTYASDQVEAQALGKYDLGAMSLKILLGAQYNPFSTKTWMGQIANNPAYGPVGSPLPNYDLRDPSTWNRIIPASFTRDQMTTNAISTDSNYKDEAVYGGLTAGFFKDRLLVLAGMRRTSSESQTITLTQNGAAVNSAGPKFHAERNTPQVGALYKITSDISAFASYSESFVPQPQTLSAYVKDTPAWTPTIKGPAQPTEGKGYDVGIKTSLLDGRVSSTLTYFRNDNANIINSIAELNPNTGVQFFESIQSGKQRSEGVEFDLTWSITDNWQVYASASVADSKILYFISPQKDAYYLAVTDPSTLNAGDQSNFKNVYRFHGKPLQMSAPRQFNLWTRYNFVGSLKGLYVAGGANHISDQTILPDTPSWAHQTYTLWNALVGYSVKIIGRQSSVEISGKNLGNEHYRPSQSSRGRPREFLLSVSTKF